MAISVVLFPPLPFSAFIAVALSIHGPVLVALSHLVPHSLAFECASLSSPLTFHHHRSLRCPPLPVALAILVALTISGALSIPSPSSVRCPLYLPLPLYLVLVPDTVAFPAPLLVLAPTFPAPSHSSMCKFSSPPFCRRSHIAPLHIRRLLHYHHFIQPHRTFHICSVAIFIPVPVAHTLVSTIPLSSPSHRPLRPLASSILSLPPFPSFASSITFAINICGGLGD